MTMIKNFPDKIWDYESNVFNRLSHKDIEECIMTPAEQRFLSGSVRYLKPKRILELGVCGGGGSVILLNAISDLPQTKLYSIDILQNHPEKADKLIGFCAKEKFPNCKQWELYTGKEPSEIIEELYKDGLFDFVVIDTMHIHPVETLNFITILPYLTDDAYVYVHDLALYAINTDFRRNSNYKPLGGFPNINIAPKLLFDCVVADKYVLPWSAYAECGQKVGSDRNTFTPESWNIVYSNAGILQISNDTRKYVSDMFSCLEIPWALIPLGITSIQNSIKKNYSKALYNKFRNALLGNIVLINSKYTTFDLQSNILQLTKFENIVLYGCGKNLKACMKDPLNVCNLADEVWDKNADHIYDFEDTSFLHGIELKMPDLSLSTEQKKTVAVIITTVSKDLKKEMKSELVSRGYLNIFEVQDLD